MAGPLDIARIENAIKAAIIGLQRPYLRGAHTYRGELDGDLTNVVSRLPAVWVTFGGGEIPRKFTNRERWIRPLTFVTLVGVRNLRSEEAARHGDVNNPGTYQLIQDVHDALLGKDLADIDAELHIDPFQPGRLRPLYNNAMVNNNAISVFAVEWHTRVVIERLEPDAPWLTSLAMDFVLEPDNETADLDASLDLWGDGGAFPDGAVVPDGSEEPR